jgi:hypothetical protein
MITPEGSRAHAGRAEKNPRVFARIASWAGAIANKLVNKREQTPEDVGQRFTKLVDGLTRGIPTERQSRSGALIRTGVAESPSGGMYGVLVERPANGLGVDKISVQGLSPDAPAARVVYQGPNTAESTVARRTFDPQRPGIPVRAPGDGIVDAQGFDQLNQVIALTQWDPAEAAQSAQTGAYHFTQR